MSKPQVAVLIPSYKFPQPLCTDSLEQAIGYAQLKGIGIGPIQRKHGCLIHTARNQMIQWVYRETIDKGKRITHFLFVDDDMVLDKDTIPTLLSWQKDVIGGIYVRRSDPPYPNAWLPRASDPENDHEPLLEWNQRLVEVAGMGAGCLLVTARVIEAMARYWVDCGWEREAYALTDEQVAPERARRDETWLKTREAFWFEFLPWRGTQLGEDMAFCYKARRSGFKCFVDMECTPGHLADYPYGIGDWTWWRDNRLKKDLT